MYNMEKIKIKRFHTCMQNFFYYKFNVVQTDQLLYKRHISLFFGEGGKRLGRINQLILVYF